MAPATLAVNTLADNPTDTNFLTLRDAVTLVNNAGDPASLGQSSMPAGWASQIDTTSGGFGSDDTILFRIDTNQFGPAPWTITLGGTELLVSRDVTIRGPGADQLAISGDNTSRVFEINTPDLTAVVGPLGVPQNSNVTAGIFGLTIEHGYTDFYGGAIHNNGTLTVGDCTITGNASLHTTFGGSPGIENFDRLTVSNCAFVGNVGANGGGILNYGTGTVINSSFFGNYASNGGGAVFEFGAAGRPDPLTLTNCTLYGNTAGVTGGGLFNFNGTPIVANTIIAGNTILPSNASPVDVDFGGSTLVSEGYNLIGISNSRGLRGFGATGDQVGTAATPIDPLLAPLGNYGGPTPTLPPLPGSPAGGRGNVALAVDASGNQLATDQRGPGFPRVVNSGVDVGAVEANGLPLEGLIQQALSLGDPVTIQVNSVADAVTVVQAINDLSAQNATVSGTVTLNLAPITYGGVTVNVPDGMTLIIGTTNYTGGRQATIDPDSPAFTVGSGNVFVFNVTFVTTGDAPTVLVTGGRLTLRNCTVQESTGSADAAISVTGGALDLGTAADPGGNTLNVNGAGTLVANSTSKPVAAAGDTFLVNGAPLAPDSLSGIAFEDFNDDGQVDFGETGVRGVTVTLTGRDFLGNAVNIPAVTDADGAYIFANLRPGNYSLTETQPAGYNQGVNSVGTAGGSVSATDQFFVQLAQDGGGVNGLNYNFGEQPAATGPVRKGQAAGIGFWNNKNGQALILNFNGGPTATQLANWLAATLPNTFGVNAGGNNLTGKGNAFVAALFQQDFLMKGVKLDAQVLATALNVYATNATLDSTGVARQYGFTVSGDGVGTAAVNVGGNGNAFGVGNDSVLTVLDLLKATDAQAVNGVLYGGNVAKRNEANTVYSAVNQAGGIG